MDLENKKCVLVIDNTLHLGVVANVASILSITIGSKISGLIGPDVADASGSVHPGLTQLPIPVLGATSEEIRLLRSEYLSVKGDNDFIVDFTGFAAKAKTYDQYAASLQVASGLDITYYGIGLLTDKKTVNKITRKLNLIGQNQFAQ